MERFYFEKPSMERKYDIIDFLQEFADYNSDINGTGSLDKIFQGYTFEDALKRTLLMEDKDYAESQNRCPGRTYLLIRESDNKIVGTLNLRWDLTEAMQTFGGNIGYSIRPTERRKGYNKINLYLGLLEAKKQGLDRVMLDCDAENIASDKTMQALGGDLERTEIDPFDGILTKVYWFNVNESIVRYKDIYTPMIKGEIPTINILSDIMEDALYVSNNSTHVKINHDKLNELIDSYDISSSKFWLSTNPFDILSLDVKTIINFLLVYHTIGDYCFWGEPKWEINTPYGKLDGSYAMMYILINRLKNHQGFDMSYDEFKTLLASTTQIPLLDDRYNNLIKMNEFLKNNGDNFYDLIYNLTNDIDLFNYIISNLDYYKDKTTYKEREIKFYKRAQLLTSDILHVREMLEHIEVDYTHLAGCADYKIPQVLRNYGVLEFDDELANLVDNKEIIEPNSEYEIEIRANDLVVINLLYLKLSIPRIDINDFIWLLGQDKSKMIKPYHRTITNNY